MWRRIFSSPQLKTLTSSSHSHPRSAVAALRFTGLSRHVATQSAGSVKKTVEDVVPIATGHEREEIQADLEGRNILEIDHPEGPFGTKEAPAVVKSYYNRRIVGCPGGEGGYVRGFSSASWGLSGRNQSENVNTNSNASARPDFMRDREIFNSISENKAENGGNFRKMDFVRGNVEENEKGVMGGYLYNQYHFQHDADFVHIKMRRNNTFVTVTDSKGNVKLSGSAGSLKDMKSGQKLSRYAAEATAEVVGRRSRSLGLKSVVMKVNGFTHFRRKRQAILSWREGFIDSRGDKNPIVYIEDTTRRPHNGCRLPKNRRI